MLDLERRLSRHASQLEMWAPQIDLPEVRSMAASTGEGRIGAPLHVSHRKLLIAIALLALGLMAAGITLALQSSTVEPGPGLGKSIEIVVAPDGKPFLVYYDRASDGLTFAECDDRLCKDDPELTEVSGWAAVVTMRPDGRPLIWMDGPDGTDFGPWIVDCLEPACSEHVRTEAAKLPARVDDLSPTGAIVLTYWDDDGRLMIGTCPEATCRQGMASTVIEGTQYPQAIEAVLDGDDNPVVTYVSGSELRLVRCDAPDCAGGYTQQVLAAGDFDELTPYSVAIDPDDRPWIAHGRYGVQIVRCTDRACTSASSVPLASLERAWGIQLLLGTDGSPIVVYRWSASRSVDMLKVARCHDVNCATGTVAIVAEGRGLFTVAATLDDRGFPVVAHRTREGVVSTVCADPGCVAGAVESTTWDHSAPTTTTTVPPGGPVKWRKVAAVQEAFGAGALIVDAVGGDGQVIAVGQPCATIGCYPTAWVSRDGASWTATRIADHGEVTQVARSATGLAARLAICESDDDCRTEIWTSADGTVWSRSELEGCGGADPDPACHLEPHMVDLVGSDAGYALLGMRTDQPTAVLWASSDGAGWRQVDLGITGYVEAIPNAAWSLADRLIVQVNACNFSEDGTDHCRKRQWTSTDSASWLESQDELIFWLHDPRPVVWSGGAVAFGYWIEDYEWIPKVWTSPDGIDWTVTPLQGLMAEDVLPGTMVGIGEGLFGITRFHDNLEDRERAFLFTSSDGASWTMDEYEPMDFPSNDDRLGWMVLTTLGDSAIVIGDAVWQWGPAD